MTAHEKHPAHGPSHYIKIWAILLVLLCVSVAGPMVAPHVAGTGTLLAKFIVLSTAFGIAIVKAYMVARNFMHLNIEPRFVTYIVGTMLLFIFIFFGGVSPDIMKHEGQQWSNQAAKEEIKRAELKAAEQPAEEH